MKLILKILRKIVLKVVLIVLGIALSLAILTIVGLNIAKFAIYGEYYANKSDLCTNPGLGDGFVCQGIAVADGHDRILVSGYMTGDEASRIYVTTLDGESYYVSLSSGGEKFTGHAGGIAVTAGCAYIASGSRVYTVSLDSILSAEDGAVIDIGKGEKVNNSASFIYSDDKYIYVGEFHDGGKYNIEGHENETSEGTHYAICSVYNIADFSAPVRVYSIRNKVQGIAFADDGRVLMATSYGLADSVYYLYDANEATDSGKTFDGAPLYYLDSLKREIKGPAMAEGVDIYEGRFITLTESASNKYIYGKLFFADKIVSLDIKK